MPALTRRFNPIQLVGITSHKDTLLPQIFLLWQRFPSHQKGQTVPECGDYQRILCRNALEDVDRADALLIKHSSFKSETMICTLLLEKALLIQVIEIPITITNSKNGTMIIVLIFLFLIMKNLLNITVHLLQLNNPIFKKNLLSCCGLYHVEGFVSTNSNEL